jgi:FAD/FMN-containing dehydrogenase/Fe-S oxidoreductase
MDPDRARIEEDLKGLLEGQVRCDDTFLHLYASDASLYEIQPIGVVRPMHTADVVACVNYARENDITLIPRGAGSNVLGATAGQGLILDFSYSMRRILSVDRESVTVEPGLVLGDLNEHLASHGKMFGPDPFNRNVSTIGGMLSLNTSGSHWLKTGTPREHVISLQVVMASGEVVEFQSDIVEPSTVATTERANENAASLYQQKILHILQRHKDRIDAGKPDTKVNQAGYNVFDLRRGNDVDLTRLLVGSEGTLGIITEAKLRTISIPRHRGVVLIFFHSLDTAARAAVEISKTDIVACDLLDRRLLSLARESNARNRFLIPAEAEAMLLVEIESSDDSRLRDKAEALVNRVVRKKKWAFHSQTTTQTDVRNSFWRIARRSVPTLYRMQGDRRAIPFVEDIGIAPDRLPDFLKQVHAILNKHELTASIFCHAPQGTVHVRPFVKITNPDQVAKMHGVANDLFEKVLELNGTISATRGDGLSRSWFLRRQYGELNSVFSEIKDLFDPQEILNSGKVASDRFSGLTDNLRHFEITVGTANPSPPNPKHQRGDPTHPGSPEDQSQLPDLSSLSSASETRTEKSHGPVESIPLSSATLPIITPELNWSLPEMASAAQNCNGCGRCRSNVKIQRMCPVFRLSPREEASPRAKANLMRGVLTGQLPPETVTTEEFKDVADLCVNCHQCRMECPAKVDIPQLMVEAKAQYLSVNGMKLSDWVLTRLDWLYAFAGTFPWAVNLMLKTRSSRWMLDRLLGIAQGRKLPTFDNRTFQRWAQRSRLYVASKQSSRKVVFFVDAFANWNDVELGIAFCNVLKHNKIDVLVPSRQDVSGMSLISEGAIPRAKKIAARNVEMLADWVRQGYQIVTTEPSAALAIKHEYLNLMDDEDALMVARNTTDSSAYLLNLHQAGELELDFKPVNATIGYHLPCHQKALIDAERDSDGDIPGVKLLNLIPGLQVEVIEKGCSGMAGTYGLKRKNYHRSLRMGLQLIQAMRSPTIMAGTTECSTCKIQMEQGTNKPTIHPIKILALAYGLMPELDNLFDRRSGELTIS